MRTLWIAIVRGLFAGASETARRASGGAQVLPEGGVNPAKDGFPSRAIVIAEGLSSYMCPCARAVRDLCIDGFGALRAAVQARSCSFHVIPY